MIIVRLTKASRYVRLSAAEKILECNSPYPIVRVVHSPDDSETLVFMEEFRVKTNQPYLEIMPVAHSPQLTQDQYNALAQHATTAAIDVKSARQQLTTALREKQDLAVVVSLEKPQAAFSRKFATALNRIVTDSKSEKSVPNPKDLSDLLAACIADLVYKKLLPPMLAARKIEQINSCFLSIADLSGAADMALWLRNHKISTRKQADCDYAGSIIFEANEKLGYQGFILFDSTVGRPEKGPALEVRGDNLLKLAAALLPAYGLLLRNSTMQSNAISKPKGGNDAKATHLRKRDISESSKSAQVNPKRARTKIYQ